MVGLQSSMCARNGRRQSVFRSYVFPLMDRPNLTVLTGALVLRLTWSGKRVTGVQVSHEGKTLRLTAGTEVVLSLGAINTPKVLMQTGYPSMPSRSPENEQGKCYTIWCAGEWLALFGGLIRPKSRGCLRLTGPDPDDPIDIESSFLSHPDDFKAAIACVDLCREVGNSAPLQPFVKREVMPDNLKGSELDKFVRDAAVTYWHETCTLRWVEIQDLTKKAWLAVTGHVVLGSQCCPVVWDSDIGRASAPLDLTILRQVRPIPGLCRSR